jgi:hypothetical protein
MGGRCAMGERRQGADAYVDDPRSLFPLFPLFPQSYALPIYQVRSCRF